ncbi:MAG: hypothetical protein JST54_18680 [Deltaproteobacteria bacterium]|nr:hypothetical protein [Deltaproteobacteria bacterium]
MSDDHGHAAAPPAELPKFTSSPAMMGGAAVLGVIGLVVAWATAGSPARFWASYLTGMLYWMVLALGSMFMLLTFHAAAAKWVTGFRRIMEVCAQGVWLQSILGLIFVFFGASSIYKWMKPGFVYGEEGDILDFKMWWLNSSRFTVRSVIYVVVFSVTVYLLKTWSEKQDTSNDQKWFTNLVRLGSGGVPLVGLTATAMCFDWIMTLDPDWASTIYGAYVLAGGYLCALAFTALLAHQRREGVLKGVAGTFEFHNLGKLLFALVCFWAYLGYAQYMLMWIANLPEEIKWWLRRFDGEWRIVFWILIFGHFVAPFFMLLRKKFKLISGWMKFVAVYIMAVCFVDIAFLVLPSDSIHGQFQLSDLCAVIGIGGLHLAFISWRFNGVVVAPKGDPNFGAPVAVH